MDLFDVLVILVLILATWGGYRAGLAGPALGLIGAVAGLAVVIAVAPTVLPALDGMTSRGGRSWAWRPRSPS